MPEPIWKEHTFKVMEQAPEAKCISLLSQVMDEFKDTLSPGEIDAVAAWFGKNYKVHTINPPLYFEGNGKAVIYQFNPEDLLTKY